MILPTAYPFTKFVRVYSMVFSFISKCRKSREILSRLLAEGRVVFRMFNVNLEDEAREETGREPFSSSGFLQSMPEASEVMGLASIAMVVTLEHIEVDGVSLASIFNKDLFQSQESRAQFSSTQVANDDQAM